LLFRNFHRGRRSRRDENEALEAGRRARCEDLRDLSTHRLTYEDVLRKPQRLNDGCYVIGLSMQVEASRVFVRPTPAAKIRGETTVALGQLLRNQVPRSSRSAQVVNEHQGRLFDANLPKVELESVGTQFSIDKGNGHVRIPHELWFEVGVGACKLEEAAHGRNDIIASNSAILH
jgi:hypothetical protein